MFERPSVKQGRFGEESGRTPEHRGGNDAEATTKSMVANWFARVRRSAHDAVVVAAEGLLVWLCYPIRPKSRSLRPRPLLPNYRGGCTGFEPEPTSRTVCRAQLWWTGWGVHQTDHANVLSRKPAVSSDHGVRMQRDRPFIAPLPVGSRNRTATATQGPQHSGRPPRSAFRTRRSHCRGR